MALAAIIIAAFSTLIAFGSFWFSREADRRANRAESRLKSAELLPGIREPTVFPTLVDPGGASIAQVKLELENVGAATARVDKVTATVSPGGDAHRIRPSPYVRAGGPAPLECEFVVPGGREFLQFADFFTVRVWYHDEGSEREEKVLQFHWQQHTNGWRLELAVPKD